MMDEYEIKNKVREDYGRIASESQSGCGCGCGPTSVDSSVAIGYSKDDLSGIPEDAILGLGCGNPIANAELKEGETVLDLGSGGGIDCFLAAKRVGESGQVIGVDMTSEMINRARETKKRESIDNVEFRLGEIENLPVADNAVDLIISNCVINLSTDKQRVFKETFRVLKPGGRINVSDIVLVSDLPDRIKNDLNFYVGCVSGAVKESEYLGLIEKAGFKDISTTLNFDTGAPDNKQVPIKSITVKAFKPEKT